MGLQRRGRGRSTALLLGVLAAAWLAATNVASAACHTAGFTQSDVTASESAGSVTLIVELQGRQPNCSGTVQFETRDGTATAGTDYEAQSGELTFVANDDREESIVVTISADDEVEGGETFTVVLTGASGVSLGSPSTATVTITDDQAGATPTPTQPEDTQTDDDETEDADEPGDIDDGDDDDSGALLLIGGAAVAVVILGGLLLARMRRS